MFNTLSTPFSLMDSVDIIHLKIGRAPLPTVYGWNGTLRTPVDTEGAPLHQRTLWSEVILLKAWNSRLPCQSLSVASIGNCILHY